MTPRQLRAVARREQRAARRAHLAQRLEEFRDAEKHEYYGDQRLEELTTKDGYGWPKFLGGALLVLALLTLFGCGAPSAEQLWLAEQVERCRAQGGEFNYDQRNTKDFECFRTPFMRHPKRLFKRNFYDDKENTAAVGRA